MDRARAEVGGGMPGSPKGGHLGTVDEDPAAVRRPQQESETALTKRESRNRDRMEAGTVARLGDKLRRPAQFVTWCGSHPRLFGELGRG